MRINSSIRMSNFEFLRILSMIFIISHHYVVHGGSLNIELGINRLIAQFLAIGGKLGVNCFVLISGYFLVDSNFKFKTLLKIIFQVFLYSIGILIIIKLFHLGEIKSKYILTALFPITYSLYWFPTVYIGLYVLFPFINILINTLSKQKYIMLIIVLTTMLSIIPTITETKAFISNLMWFIYLYILAGYFKNYPIQIFKNNFNYLVVFILSYLFIFISSVTSVMNGESTKEINYFSSMNSIPLLLCSITLFLYFKDISLKYNKLINIFAQTTFGVYLIHDNGFFKKFMWKTIIRTPDYYHSKFYILHALMSIIVVFVICSGIDLLRIYFIEKPIFKIKIFDKYFGKIDNMFPQKGAV